VAGAAVGDGAAAAAHDRRRIVASPDLGVLARGVLVDAVLRVLRNPDGKVQESIDDYSYRRADAVADGSLYLTDDEWALLAGPGSAVASNSFTIVPYGVRGHGPVRVPPFLLERVVTAESATIQGRAAAEALMVDACRVERPDGAGAVNEVTGRVEPRWAAGV
jgi:hypothetical protein